MRKPNELKEIAREESKIILEERKIVREEKFLQKNIDRVVSLERALQNVAKVKISFLRKFARHKFLFSLIGGTGVVLVWRGLWDISETIPGLESSVVALVVGLGILWLLEKYADI